MLQFRLKAYSLAVLPLVMVVVGCGDSDRLSRAQVTGTVTLDGKPINVATIIFRPSSGRAGRGLVKDGEIVSAATYDLDDGIVLGSHKIAIQPILADVKPAASRIDEDQGVETGKSPQATSQEAPPGKVTTILHIPSKYRYPDRSGLTADIVSGDNRLNFDLKSK